MPRNSKNRAYTATWITPGQMRKLRAAARREGLSVSGLVRTLILAHLGRSGEA